MCRNRKTINNHVSYDPWVHWSRPQATTDRSSTRVRLECDASCLPRHSPLSPFESQATERRREMVGLLVRRPITAVKSLWWRAATSTVSLFWWYRIPFKLCMYLCTYVCHFLLSDISRLEICYRSWYSSEGIFQTRNNGYAVIRYFSISLFHLFLLPLSPPFLCLSLLSPSPPSILFPPLIICLSSFLSLSPSLPLSLSLSLSSSLFFVAVISPFPWSQQCVYSFSSFSFCAPLQSYHLWRLYLLNALFHGLCSSQV